MDGMTWNTEEVKKLRRLRLDPIRNTPDRLRSLVEHFLKPGASVFAVTEGKGRSGCLKSWPGRCGI